LKTSKIHLKIIGVVAGSSLLVLFLRWLVRGSAGDWIVGVLQDYFHLNTSQALRIYQNVIRNNLDYIIIAAIAGCVILLSVILVSYSRKQRAKEARIAEQRRNELVAYLAHDIRTPLTSVIGYLSLLNESPDMPEEQKLKHLGIALEKAYRLESLVNQFFEITQLNAQTKPLTKMPIDLYYMLAQMIEEFYPQLAASGKQAVIHVPEDLTVSGDPDKLARVFSNILKNAAVYSTVNSMIDVTAKHKNDMIVIEFRNAGSIPQDQLASIFDKFTRLDAARSSGTGGTGLGLAIAKEIVALHGGRIYAQSDDSSTTFTIELPA